MGINVNGFNLFFAYDSFTSKMLFTSQSDMVDGQNRPNQLIFMNFLTRYLATRQVQFFFVPQESSGAKISISQSWQKQLQSEQRKKPWLFTVTGDYTIQLYGDYNEPL